jgi:hypothetical protein
MAHYAYIDETNTVVSVITGRDEDDLAPGVTSWEDYYGAQRPGLTCLRTSYNTRAGQHTSGGTPFRGNYAGVGYTYREDLDAFIPPQPYPSWTLNEECYCWEAPSAYPEDGKLYTWDESEMTWKETE